MLWTRYGGVLWTAVKKIFDVAIKMQNYQVCGGQDKKRGDIVNVHIIASFSLFSQQNKIRNHFQDWDTVAGQYKCDPESDILQINPIISFFYRNIL